MPRVSAALAVLQVALAVLHLFPRLVFSDSPVVAVVRFINDLGPVWSIGFGLSGAALALALRYRRCRHWSHLACVFVWAWYAAALWIGSFAVTPVAPVRLALIVTGLAVVHLVAASQYANDPAEGRRR